MSNITANRINMVMADADLATMNTSLTTYLSKLPPNSALSAEERLQYNAIDVSNKVFCEDVLNQAKKSGQGILPPFLSTDALEKDLKLFAQLDEQEIALQNLLKRVQDAKRIAGHEAYSVATGMYQSFKQASDSGVPNAAAAYEQLKVRFQTQNPVKTLKTPEDNKTT